MFRFPGGPRGSGYFGLQGLGTGSGAERRVPERTDDGIGVEDSVKDRQRLDRGERLKERQRM